MSPIPDGYTAINVYTDDRERAKEAKRRNETWSEFLRRAAEELDPDTHD